jgi:hypothetical protein
MDTSGSRSAQPIEKTCLFALYAFFFEHEVTEGLITPRRDVDPGWNAFGLGRWVF